MTLIHLETPFDMRIYGYTAQIYAYHKSSGYTNYKQMEKSKFLELIKVKEKGWETHIIFDHYDSLKPQDCKKMVFLSHDAYRIFLHDLSIQNDKDEVEMLFDLLVTNGLISKEGAKK